MSRRRASTTRTITLLKYQSDFVGRDLLDLGVGAGRTTRILAGLAHHYVAIGYSTIALSELRRSFPELEV